MQDLLREIFDVIYIEKVPSQPMTQAEYKVWDKAQEILGGDLLDEMIHSQSRSLTEAQYVLFREGFRLGARLMLELTQAETPVNASSTGWGTAAAAAA